MPRLRRLWLGLVAALTLLVPGSRRGQHELQARLLQADTDLDQARRGDDKPGG